VDGGNAVRPFTVAAGTTCELDFIQIADGNASVGGGIDNSGSLTLTHCDVSNCASSTDGGGIYNGSQGSLYLDHTAVYSNSATSRGGGIFNTGGTVSIYSGCGIAANQATDGGGIYNAGMLAIGDNSEVTGNNASGDGGGIFNDSGSNDSMTMGASSLSSNVAGNRGGGLYSLSGAVTFTGTDIEYNQATNKGGGFYLNGTSSLLLNTCTLSNNTSPFGPGGAWKTGSTYSPPIGGTITDAVVKDP
jgi:hypothetical protein